MSNTANKGKGNDTSANKITNKEKINKTKKNEKRKYFEDCNSSIHSTTSNKKVTYNSSSGNNTETSPHVFTFNESLINNKDILKIATHNIRSLCSPLKQQLLIQTLENYKIDIMGISETNLSTRKLRHIHRKLDVNYNYFFSADKRYRGSGVGILVHRSIAAHIFNSYEYKGRFLYIDLQMKNKRKVRIFQVYLYTSNYDIKDRVNVQNITKEHIQQAHNKQFEIIVMGDFNVNPDKLRHTETKYKRQYEIIQFLKNLFFYDIFDSVYTITEQDPHNTWFNTAKNTAFRIDLMWCSENTIHNLISCTAYPSEIYESDHHLLIGFFDKAALFGEASR